MKYRTELKGKIGHVNHNFNKEIKEQYRAFISHYHKHRISFRTFKKKGWYF